MVQSKVKGDVFLRVIRALKNQRGSNILDRLSKDPDRYKSEAWYAFSEFLSMLKDIREITEDQDIIFRLARSVIMKDDRWVYYFEGQDPEKVFKENKKQNGLFQMGEFKVLETSPGFMRLEMVPWDDGMDGYGLWVDFYRGTMQGVLDLTGKNGNIVKKRMPGGDDSSVVFCLNWF